MSPGISTLPAGSVTSFLTSGLPATRPAVAQPYFRFRTNALGMSSVFIPIPISDSGERVHPITDLLSLKAAPRQARVGGTDGLHDLYGSFSVKWFFGLCRFLVWRCVQVRLACSAGDSPAGVKVRAP